MVFKLLIFAFATGLGFIAMHHLEIALANTKGIRSLVMYEEVKPEPTNRTGLLRALKDGSETIESSIRRSMSFAVGAAVTLCLLLLMLMF